MGTWNTRGINGVAKRKVSVEVFRKGKFELLSLTKKKFLEWKVSWDVVSDISVGVQKIERARECLAVLMNNV